jgi:hypothetical protein
MNLLKFLSRNRPAPEAPAELYESAASEAAAWVEAREELHIEALSARMTVGGYGEPSKAQASQDQAIMLMSTPPEEGVQQDQMFTKAEPMATAEFKPELAPAKQSDSGNIEMQNRLTPVGEPVPYVGRVFRSSDEKLYLVGGSNGPASLYTEAGFRRNVDCAAWDARFVDRREAITKTGSAFAQLIVPEKLSVYPLNDMDVHKIFPGTDQRDIVSPGRRLLQKIDSRGVFYPDEFLRAQSKTFPIYMPTDSHWTWQGAFSAFQALMWELGYTPGYEGFVRLPRRTLSYQGDLWEASFPSVEPDRFVRLTLPASVRRVYANSIVGLKEANDLNNELGLHVGSHCIFVNSAAEIRQTVIIFGSSFSECRVAPSLLTAIFCYFFETVHFIWTPSVDVDYVARHKPDLTIAEMPERYLATCPDDSTRVEEIAPSRIQAWRRQNPQA